MPMVNEEFVLQRRPDINQRRVPRLLRSLNVEDQPSMVPFRNPLLLSAVLGPKKWDGALESPQIPQPWGRNEEKEFYNWEQNSEIPEAGRPESECSPLKVKNSRYRDFEELEIMRDISLSDKQSDGVELDAASFIESRRENSISEEDNDHENVG